eukprot:16431492-Heterocapsa_arctica.AAC.1
MKYDTLRCSIVLDEGWKLIAVEPSKLVPALSEATPVPTVNGKRPSLLLTVWATHDLPPPAVPGLEPVSTPTAPPRHGDKRPLGREDRHAVAPPNSGQPLQEEGGRHRAAEAMGRDLRPGLDRRGAEGDPPQR